MTGMQLHQTTSQPVPAASITYTGRPHTSTVKSLMKLARLLISWGPMKKHWQHGLQHGMLCPVLQATNRHMCPVSFTSHTVSCAAEFQGVSLGAVAGFVHMHTLIALHTPAHVDFFTRRRVRIQSDTYLCTVRLLRFPGEQHHCASIADGCMLT
jgi:hypothetical protein